MSDKNQTILALFAHPDDEILGPGGTLAKYAAAGARVELVCATRGEVGEISDPALATRETLPQVREQELQCSVETLGLAGVTFLGYRDSGMEGTPENEHPEAYVQVPAEEVVARLVQIIRQKRPFALITFEPFGGYGHPDHIAIHHHTVAAYHAAAAPDYRPDLGPAWRTERLFYTLLPPDFFPRMKKLMIERDMDVSMFDAIEERRAKTWPAEKAHVRIDISPYVDQKRDAFYCHRTQFGPGNLFRQLPETEMRELVKIEYFALAQPEPAADLRIDDLFSPVR